MTKKIFITGTNTDVGKTYVSALLIKKMRDVGFDCGYYKPVVSGVLELGGRLIDSDPSYVIKFADLDTQAEDCVSYWWKEALSPHLAAKRANTVINIEKIKSMPTSEARIELMKLHGVGRKVADCILLFGFRKTDVFPTDTWIVKCYNEIYGKNENASIHT